MLLCQFSVLQYLAVALESDGEGGGEDGEEESAVPFTTSSIIIMLVFATCKWETQHRADIKTILFAAREIPSPAQTEK